MAREFSKKFYSSREWKGVRDAVMMRDNFLCVRCGKPAEEVHHIKHLTPRNIDDTDITLNPDNLVSLCRDCHFRVHEEERAESIGRANKKRVHHRIVNEDGTYLDESGMMVMRKVHIVYGAPRSGKTSYVQAHKDAHDMVVDIDAIISALQLSDARYPDNNFVRIAMGIRDYLYDQIADKSPAVDCKGVWIIGGFPDKQEREHLAERLHADLIYIKSTQKETEQRAVEANLYGDKQYSMDVVNAYWRRYQP